MWAMGAGAIPVPFVDVLGIAAVQLRMVKQLCALYGLEFNERDARSLIAALLASMGSVAVGTSLLGSLLKVVPVVGQALGGAAVTLTAGAAVHAIGSVFVQHFSAKGTLEDFDPTQMYGFVREELARAKNSIGKSW